MLKNVHGYPAIPTIIFGKAPKNRVHLPSLIRPAERVSTPYAGKFEGMIVAARQAGGHVAERDPLLIMMAYGHRLRAPIE